MGQDQLFDPLADGYQHLQCQQATTLYGVAQHPEELLHNHVNMVHPYRRLVFVCVCPDHEASLMQCLQMPHDEFPFPELPAYTGSFFPLGHSPAINLSRDLSHMTDPNNFGALPFFSPPACPYNKSLLLCSILSSRAPKSEWGTTNGPYIWAHLGFQRPLWDPRYN